jgi:PadR family transcriptional regulator, regulatory protein PadR
VSQFLESSVSGLGGRTPGWCDSNLDQICLLPSNLFVIVEEMRKRDYLGSFELMVMLALIRLGENAYGVPISREIEERSGRGVALGSVYATLERLEEKGLVSSDLGESTAERGGRAKRYFRVTAKGLREVRQTQAVLKKLWRGLPQLEGGTV